LKAAAVAVVLLLLVLQSAATFDTAALDETSFEPFTRCNDLGDAGDLTWDGSSIVSRSGIHYATVEVTKLVYGGGVPSEIGLKAPISIGGVTFSSPSPESFNRTIVMTLGVLYITVTFADGTQQKLSAILFPPAYNMDGSPRGCALLVTHEDQQAGFAFVFTPSTEPLDNPALEYSGVAGVFQGRIYVIVRARPVSTSTTVIPPPTNPQTTNATLQYDLTNPLTEDGTTCTYEWGPTYTFYRSGDMFEFNFSSTSPIDVYVFDPDDYSGRVSCTLGPTLHAPYSPDKLTGNQGRFASVCLGCEKEGGKGSSFIVLFINRDTVVTPHVTLRIAVKLYPTITTTTPRIETVCTVIGLGSLIVHVVDERGKPIQNAIVMVNGTFTCIVDGETRSGITDSSGVTELDGYVSFSVYPTKYNVSVILPATLQSRTILVTQITAPRIGTFSTTVDMTCTPSANQCTIGAPRFETSTTPITPGLLAVPFLSFPAAIIAIILGFFLLAKLRRRRD
jgi:hypothetical protein